MLYILHEYSNKHNEAGDPLDFVFVNDTDDTGNSTEPTDTVNDSGPQWGKYIYADPNQRPQDEKT